MLPKESPPWSTVYSCYQHWRTSGRWDMILDVLRERPREKEGKKPVPDGGNCGQSLSENSPKRGQRAFDNGKKVTGRKQHIAVAVDTLGVLLAVAVHAAHISTRGAFDCF
jgi:putative transposase